MRLIDSVLAELETEAVATRRLFSRIPDDRLGWKPHPKSRTLGALAMHIAAMPGGIASLALQDSFALEPGAGRDPATPQTAAEILTVFEESLKTAKQVLAQLDDKRAMADWSMMKNGKAVMSLSRIGFLRRVMLNHSYHHRGQLTVYLRLLDVPLPAVYAASADENPWEM